MPTLGIAFNSKASERINKNSPTKMRVDASWSNGEGLRFRPTLRKGGSNILVNLTPKGKGLAVEIEHDLLEKMITHGMPANFLEVGSRFSMIEDRYGWIVMVSGEQPEASFGTATVTSKR